MNYKKFTLVALLALAQPVALANTEENYLSTIAGVWFWATDSLRVDADGTVVATMKYSDYPELALYCDGKNKLFIYEKPSHAFACQTTAWDGDNVPDVKALRGKIEAKKKRGNVGETWYAVALRHLTMDRSKRILLTISKTELPHGNWSVTAPNQEEMRQAISIASDNAKNITRNEYYEYKSLLKHNEAQIRDLVGLDNHSISLIEIHSESLEIILLPTFYISSQGEAGNLISTIIVHDRQGFRFVGHVVGCVMSVGPDLDGDGMPEVIVQSCDSTFRKTVDYIKLYPTIKSLMSYDAS